MKFYELAWSFFRKMLQMRSRFATTCTTTGRRGAKLPAGVTFSESLEKCLDKVVSRSEKNFSVHKKYMNFLTHRKTALDKCLYKLSAGRSMVEMLGVLAIIGILSVGAIAGYSKAMFKYKLNKQTEQMNTIIGAVSRYYTDLKINDGSVSSFNLIPILKKLNEIPQGMYIANNEQQIEDVFKNRYSIYHHNTGYIGILVSLDSNGNSTQCRNLYMIAKAFHSDINSIFLNYGEGDSQLGASKQWGDKYCVSEENCLRNLTISKAEELCSIFNEKTTWWSLYIIWM